jgi:hypothetical protein
VSIKNIANQLVEWCNAGKNFDVMRTMYTPNIVSVEADGRETSGQQAVIQKSERWAEANIINGQVVRGPFFNGPNQFAAIFTFNVVRKATGQAGGYLSLLRAAAMRASRRKRRGLSRIWGVAASQPHWRKGSVAALGTHVRGWRER